MAKMALVMYRCDGCGITGEPEPYPEHSKIPLRMRKELLPEGWMELRGMGNKMTADSEYIQLQFCPKCTKEASRLLMGMSLDDKGIDPIIKNDKKED
jgi:hypothetical protein